MRNKLLILLVSSSFLLGCQTTGGSNQTAGTYIGAAGGAILGSQFGKGSGRLVGVALGTFIGSQLGAEIGRGMDARDRQLASQAASQTLESSRDYQAGTWKNPNTNHSGKFVVTKTTEEPANNKVCRDYVHTVYIDGQQQQMVGRACRDIRDSSKTWYVSQ